MNNWSVKKSGNCHIFSPKDRDILEQNNIHEIRIYIFDISINMRTEVHAKTYNIDTYKKILNAGKQHTADNQKSYYFDSTYMSFENLSEDSIIQFLSDSRQKMSFLEAS